MCSGHVFSMDNSKCAFEKSEQTVPVSPSRLLEMTLNNDDVYKILRLRGYEYGGKFKGIVQADNRGKSSITVIVKQITMQSLYNATFGVHRNGPC